MKHADPVRQRLMALGLAGVLLLNFPLLGLPGGDWWVIPAPVFYLFGVWAAIVGLAVMIVEKRGK